MAPMTKARARRILGVPENASINTIKSRFRELARQHHPDAGGDKEKFVEINLAFRRLTKKQDATINDIEIERKIFDSFWDMIMDDMDTRSKKRAEQYIRELEDEDG